jgi:poly(3-hydroxybutyrate) depolymerase
MQRGRAAAVLFMVACAAEPASGDAGSTGGSEGEGSTGSGTSASTTTSVTTTLTTSGPATTTGTTAAESTGASDDTGLGTTDDTGAPMGSAGCGLAAPASGLLNIDVQGMAGEYVLSIPPSYDPNVPYPLGFAFHGRGRTGPNCHDGDCAGFQAVMENDAVLVYMTSLGGDGWEGDNEREINVAFFETLLAELEDTLCIDTSRVYVAGTSSGAHFTNVLGCRFGDVLLAIAPVAGYLPETECVGEPAALVIHGVYDSHVPFSDGETARDFWRMRAGCSEDTVPTIAEVHAMVTATMETHGCAAYQGCTPSNQVTWCEHSEGGYDGSTHGWPLFGGQAIWDFVQSL